MFCVFLGGLLMFSLVVFKFEFVQHGSFFWVGDGKSWWLGKNHMNSKGEFIRMERLGSCGV